MVSLWGLYRAQVLLEQLYGGPLLPQGRTNNHVLIRLRRDSLRRIHAQQTALLQHWRAYRRDGDQGGAAQLEPQVLLSVNTIDSSLGATG